MTISITPTDVVIVMLVALSGYAGYRNGFYDGLLRISGFFGAVTISLVLLRYVARFFNFVLELPPNMSVLLGFSFIFGLLMLLQVFFMHWMHTIIKMEVVQWFDVTFGTILGAYKGLLVASLLALGFSLLPLKPSTIQRMESESMFLTQTRFLLPQNFNYVSLLIPVLPSFENSLNLALSGLTGIDDRSQVLLREFQFRRLQRESQSLRR